MSIKKAEFVISNTDYRKCPENDIPEYAFIGRSNVGKSSLINMLCGKKDLAKISSKPGKTQLINHFDINSGEWFLVDLPGYGYAKASKEMQAKWQKMISQYLLNRTQLRCVFVLVDSRIPPQTIDLNFMEWLGENGIPFCIVLTKIDKEKQLVVSKNLNLLKARLLETWEDLPEFIMTSSRTGRGQAELLSFIEKVNLV